MEEPEIWKIIEGYENYEVSTFGNVRNIKTNNLLRLSKKGNYYSIGLTNKHKNRKSFRVHRLVCKTFIPNPDNKIEVNHKDKNGLNNNVLNLEWNSHQENCIHRSNGIKNCNNRNIKVYKLDLQNKIIDTYNSMEDAAKWLIDNKLSKSFNAAKSVICVSVKNNKIGYGFNWKRVEQINFENEEWREIIFDNNYSGYFISSLGRIKNKKNIIMENYKIHHSGYIYTRINYNKYAIHRLVAMMFIPNLENKPFVNHIDGNKTNNKLDNLNWVTCYENNIHNHNMGFVKYYTKKIGQYKLNGELIKEFNSIKEASNILNIGNTNILGALKNRQNTAGGFIWKYLDLYLDKFL
jgi:hypothetical protein